MRIHVVTSLLLSSAVWAQSSGAQSLCSGFSLPKGSWINVEPAQKNKTALDGLRSFWPDLVSVETLGEGGEGVVLRCNFQPQSNQDPFVMKFFKDFPVGSLLHALEAQLGPPAPLHAEILGNLRRILQFADVETSFKTVRIVRVVDDRTLILENLVGRDLDKILSDQSIPAHLRQNLLLSYNKRVEALLTLLRSHFRTVEVRDSRESDRDLRSSFLYKGLGSALAAFKSIVFVDETGKINVLTLKPTNIIVNESDLNMSIADVL